LLMQMHLDLFFLPNKPLFSVDWDGLAVSTSLSLRPGGHRFPGATTFPPILGYQSYFWLVELFPQG
jgi:hypothetical protein